MTYVWLSESSTPRVIVAPDRDTAYRIAISKLLAGGKLLPEAVSVLSRSELLEADRVSDAPFVGDLPTEEDSAALVKCHDDYPDRSPLDFDDVFHPRELVESNGDQVG